jgi:hypothetical protein
MADELWKLEDVAGVRLLTCAALAAVPGIAHAFSTRIGGGGAEFDLGQADDNHGPVIERRRQFLRAAGFDSAPAAVLRQVHGARIVDAAPWPADPPPADGVLRVLPGTRTAVIPAVRTADCVAVLAVDRNGTAVAALHAGWRGVAAGIGAAAVARFAAAGVGAADLVIALGPAIAGCCYEVGDDVVAAMAIVCRGSRAHLGISGSGRTTVDLPAALRTQFVGSGVPAASIHTAPFCTRCRTDLFFSYRAEGRGTGRLMAAVGPSAGP